MAEKLKDLRLKRSMTLRGFFRQFENLVRIINDIADSDMTDKYKCIRMVNCIRPSMNELRKNGGREFNSVVQMLDITAQSNTFTVVKRQLAMANDTQIAEFKKEKGRVSEDLQANAVCSQPTQTVLTARSRILNATHMANRVLELTLRARSGEENLDQIAEHASLQLTPHATATPTDRRRPRDNRLRSSTAMISRKISAPAATVVVRRGSGLGHLAPVAAQNGYDSGSEKVDEQRPSSDFCGEIIGPDISR
jgi:hypothetical protein